MRWAARRAALITVTGVLSASAVAMTVGPAHAGAVTHAAGAGTHAVAGTHGGHATAVTGHAVATSAGQQAGVRRYWTRARMERAVPLFPAKARHLMADAMRSAGGQPGSVDPVSQRAPASIGNALGIAPQASQPAQASQAPQTSQAPQAPAQQPYSAAVAAAHWSGTGAVARTTGKVFFTMSGNDYVCSGSTVASANSDVVVTAGHCVKNGSGAWATNWTFLPGYANGNAPYGTFTAGKFYVASQWSTQADNDYDVAFVTLNTASVNGSQVRAVQEVGGQGIEFGHQPSPVTVFGYPADSPYNGGQLYYCSGPVSSDPYHETDDTGLSCAMTAGSSGGPWFTGFNAATGTGTIVSVSSFKYSNNNQTLYGTPFGTAAQQLYQSAQSN
ncbi:MAG: trypsin-like serine peptidase [Streptosporangiaceae bacterium]